jgi:hypothetical protein
MTDFKQSRRLAMGYQGPASGKRYEMWREEICRSFCRLDAGPSESERIDCRVDFTFMHSLTLATPTGLSAGFARTRELLTDGCDDLVLISASRGPVHVIQGEQTIQLGTSQACLVEMNAAASVALDEAGRFTNDADAETFSPSDRSEGGSQVVSAIGRKSGAHYYDREIFCALQRCSGGFGPGGSESHRTTPDRPHRPVAPNRD